MAIIFYILVTAIVLANLFASMLSVSVSTSSSLPFAILHVLVLSAAIAFSWWGYTHRLLIANLMAILLLAANLGTFMMAGSNWPPRDYGVLCWFVYVGPCVLATLCAGIPLQVIGYLLRRKE